VKLSHETGLNGSGNALRVCLPALALGILPTWQLPRGGGQRKRPGVSQRRRRSRRFPWAWAGPWRGSRRGRIQEEKEEAYLIDAMMASEDRPTGRKGKTLLPLSSAKFSRFPSRPS